MRIPGIFPFAPIAMLYSMSWRNGGVSLSRIPLLILYMIRYLLLEPFRLAEIIFYDRKIKSHVLKQPPIFILGHWRSGTSFLQALICNDIRMTSNTIFRSLFPDNFYVTEPWLKPLLNFFCKTFKVQYAIQRTPMDLDLPAEADMSLCSLCSEHSYTWGHLFPGRFDQWVEKKILFKDGRSDEWIRDYDYFIRKLSFRAKGKRVAVKSPGDTGRVLHLLRAYPNALFIYIHRDMEEVFQSNVYFWKVLQQQVSLQKIGEARIKELIIRNYERIQSSYTEQRILIPATQLAEVQFHDLVKDPTRELSVIYEKLGLNV